MTPPRVLYLHGFASGPGSKKGVAVAARLGGVDRLDLRVPSIERLSLAAMIATARAAIGGPRDRAILIGSSLGGLTAARLAEDEPRVCMLILLAPAFRFAERLRARVGPDGWIETHDHATGGTARIHPDFVREAEGIDAAGDGWPDVRVPTVILHGTRDDVVPIELSRQFAADRPHVRLIELDDDHELLATLPVILDVIEQLIPRRR
jgi:pimeloyl-ACP methyl ester carboxylesterase